jgi:ThiF family protein
VPDHEMQSLAEMDLSIAMSGPIDIALVKHFDKGPRQEDLTFAYWKPSRGATRYSALLNQLALPADDERILQGNVAFTDEYLGRVLDKCPEGHGIALLHSHFTPGWQGMSRDDVIAEQDRLASVVAGRTLLPLVGLTWGTDGTWSGRFWFRVARFEYEKREASTIRVVGEQLRISYHPKLRPVPQLLDSEIATRSVWGDEAQNDLARTRVGVVGLGSVGSIIAEALRRTGFRLLTFVDHDRLEERNLDRTLGSIWSDLGKFKVTIAERLARQSHLGTNLEIRTIQESLVKSPAAIAAALDCDAIISCVDRPWPRDVLNKMAYMHLIPVVDGGILAEVKKGSVVCVDWRIHTLGPQRTCLYCLGAQRRGDAALEQSGQLENPDYIKGLSEADRERYKGRNVFVFSLSVAAHEVLQLVGLLSGQQRVGGTGPQYYHAYPGEMEVEETRLCDENCDIAPLVGTGHQLVQFPQTMESAREAPRSLVRRLLRKIGIGDA